MIDPSTRDLYVISKREQPVSVYRLAYPQSTNGVSKAEKISQLDKTYIVAGDFSQDGKEILIKNIDNVYYWKVDGRSIAEVLKDKPKILPYEKEPQGEAITFAIDGSGYYTLSEDVTGEKSYLQFYKRKKK
jgi:hypothetical protein